jgi:hypothetical protein
MAETSLNTTGAGFDAGIDSITINQYLGGIDGVRSLDVTGFAPDVIRAGHVVIKETATGTCKPMPVTPDGTAYAALPAGHTVAGVAVASVTKDLAMVGIMDNGRVNEAASPYPVTPAIKAALPLIVFMKD